MLTIGLLGGVASGKSLVAKMLSEMGAAILDADRTGHAVLSSDPHVANKLSQCWGQEILDSTGTIDRSRVATLVFGDSETATENRQLLESILHPAIRGRIEEQRKTLENNEQCRVVVLDAPLLLEAGWDAMCDLLVFVETPWEMRIELAETRGWDVEELQHRQQAQMDLSIKRQRADIVLKNCRSMDDLNAQVRGFWTSHVTPRLQSCRDDPADER